MMKITHSKFNIGAIVRHRHFDFRGVIFDIDPEFSNTDEWYESIPAENPETYYVAYVSEQNLVDDRENGEVAHPMMSDYFRGLGNGRYMPKNHTA